MNPDQIKSKMANLPEENQEALAELALMEMKKCSRLEQLASGSNWKKFGLIFPIIVLVAFLGFKGNLANYLPFIIIFLLFLIQGVSASIHSRIDAICELIKLRDQRVAQDNHKEPKQAGTPSTGNVSI
jgi:hypothetical protein